MDRHTKERIIEAALDLFYHQGFHQTTVRQIADKARLNQALISYHFGGKNGLLEQLMVDFYERYFAVLEAGPGHDNGQLLLDVSTPMERLWQTLGCSFDYLFLSYRMTRFIYRELSLDSNLTREVMPLYLAREKYLYESLIGDVLRDNGRIVDQEDAEMIVFQLLNMLYMPFLQPQIVREVYHVEPHSEQFKARYWEQIRQWITFRLSGDGNRKHGDK